MREIEAIMRLLVGSALSDGGADSQELTRIRAIADSVGARQVLNHVMKDIHRHQGQLNTLTALTDWIRPAAEVVRSANQQTRLLAMCAMDRIIREDGRILTDESEYRKVIQGLISQTTDDGDNS